MLYAVTLMLYLYGYPPIILGAYQTEYDCKQAMNTYNTNDGVMKNTFKFKKGQRTATLICEVRT